MHEKWALYWDIVRISYLRWQGQKSVDCVEINLFSRDARRPADSADGGKLWVDVVLSATLWFEAKQVQRKKFHAAKFENILMEDFIGFVYSLFARQNFFFLAAVVCSESMEFSSVIRRYNSTVWQVSTVYKCSSQNYKTIVGVRIAMKISSQMAEECQINCFK